MAMMKVQVLGAVLNPPAPAVMAKSLEDGFHRRAKVLVACLFELSRERRTRCDDLGALLRRALKISLPLPHDPVDLFERVFGGWVRAALRLIT